MGEGVSMCAVVWQVCCICQYTGSHLMILKTYIDIKSRNLIKRMVICPNFGRIYMLEDSHSKIVEKCACILIYLTILAAKRSSRHGGIMKIRWLDSRTCICDPEKLRVGSTREVVFPRYNLEFECFAWSLSFVHDVRNGVMIRLNLWLLSSFHYIQ